MAAGVDSLFSITRVMLVRKGLEEAFKFLQERRFFVSLGFLLLGFFTIRP
jgi:hypothetical protein